MFHFVDRRHVQRSRNAEIDVLRGFAIILVLINHISVAFVARPDWILYLPIDGCSIGVALFFCVSGYIITLTLRSDLQQGYDLRSFYIKRAFRIVPLSILWVEFTLFGTKLLNVHGFFGDWQSNSRAASWVLMMAANIGMRVEPGGLGALSVYWSLSVEEQFYIVVPFLMLLNRRVLAGVILFLLVNAVCIADGPVAKDFYQFTPLLMGLFAGLILPRTGVKRIVRGLAPLGYGVWIALCGLPFAANAALVSYRWYCCVYLVCALIVAAAALRQGWLSHPAPIARLFAFAGTRSYGLYLSHFAVSMVMRELWKSALDSGYVADTTGVQVAMLATWLGATFAVTEVLHRWIETPMIALGRRASDALRADHLVARDAGRADAGLAVAEPIRAG